MPLWLALPLVLVVGVVVVLGALGVIGWVLLSKQHDELGGVE
jgi:nitrogen fixation-related uncharacterized protein